MHVSIALCVMFKIFNIWVFFSDMVRVGNVLFVVYAIFHIKYSVSHTACVSLMAL